MADILPPFLQHYRINALRILAIPAFALLAVTSPYPDLPFLGLALEAAGTIAVFLAVTGRAWSSLYIGGRKNAELVMHGPYSITRKPLYFFSLVGIAGVSAQAGSVLMAIVITLVAYLAFEMAMRGEEAYLASRYGAAFEEYRDTTPRLLPKPSLWQEAERTPLRSAVAIRSLKDGIVFIAAWLAVAFLRAAQSSHLLPVYWTLPL